MTNPVLTYASGEGPLWKVFWLYGVIPSNVLWAVTLYMVWAQVPVAAISFALAILLVYTGWIVVAVWQCADNVQDERYGVVARWLTVAWAINTILVVLFLQLNILA